MSTSFEPGVPAEKGFIPLCVPEIGGNEWKYVNLRRYFAYLEHSIDKGTQWAVFGRSVRRPIRA